MNSFIYYLLQFTWGIIQNVVGIIIASVLVCINPKRKVERFFKAIVIDWNIKMSCGIGIFIFCGCHDDKRQALLVHEYGHNIQSLILGPLFLLIIGLPSFLWAVIPFLDKQRKIKRISYYKLYTEKWANNLGHRYTGLTTPL